jgi:hypothetical protein
MTTIVGARSSARRISSAAISLDGGDNDGFDPTTFARPVGASKKNLSGGPGWLTTGCAGRPSAGWPPLSISNNGFGGSRVTAKTASRCLAGGSHRAALAAKACWQCHGARRSGPFGHRTSPSSTGTVDCNRTSTDGTTAVCRAVQSLRGVDREVAIGRDVADPTLWIDVTTPQKIRLAVPTGKNDEAGRGRAYVDHGRSLSEKSGKRTSLTAGRTGDRQL